LPLARPGGRLIPSGRAAELAEGQLELLERLPVRRLLRFPEIAAAADAVRKDAHLAPRALADGRRARQHARADRPRQRASRGAAEL